MKAFWLYVAGEWKWNGWVPSYVVQVFIHRYKCQVLSENNVLNM